MTSQSDIGVFDSESSHKNIIFGFKNAWKNFDGAGSHLLYGMCSSLAGSQFEVMTKEVVALLGPVFGCGESELVLGRLKEMDNLLSGLQRMMGNKDLTSSSHIQMICRCLLLFVKLQAEYHQLCSNAISSVIDHLISACDSQENRDIVQQLKSLELDKYTSLRQSPTRGAGLKKPSSISNGSPKTPKHGSFKASLFSLFERKNSPEEGNSSFYVDVDPSASQKSSSQSDATDKGHVTENNQLDSNVLIKLGLDPGLPEEEAEHRVSAAGSQMKDGVNTNDDSIMSSEVTVKGNETLSAAAVLQNIPALLGAGGETSNGAVINGQLATQEELDSVINLLSGAGQGLTTMQTIPEHRNQLTLRVPSLHSGSLSPGTTSDSYMYLDEMMTAKTKSLQRRSEGSIDLSGFGTPGHNTWPHQHRSSLPGGQLAMYSQLPNELTSSPLPQYYAKDSRPSTLPPGSAGHFHAAYNNWGFPDPKLNRTWPVNNLTGTGSATDTLNSSWSGAHDSDDLSDDSSCGDPFHTMSQLQNIDTRRDCFRDDSAAVFMKEDRTGEVKHHSLEDLLDGRSNTWPQQLQPWTPAHHGLDVLESHDPGAVYHRPVTMQLSDPLSQGNIWQNTGGDRTKQPSSHSIQGLGQM